MSLEKKLNKLLKAIIQQGTLRKKKLEIYKIKNYKH
jgi:hypothetical protein